MGLFDNLFGLGKKKTEEPTAGFRLELLGDTRDKKLTEYQRKGLEILTSMEAERELMRRCGEPIERRFYGVCVHTRRADREYGFESPMEGIELLRHFAGQDVRWFRLREDEGPERFKPFKGEPAEYRIIETGKARPAPYRISLFWLVTICHAKLG